MQRVSSSKEGMFLFTHHTNLIVFENHCFKMFYLLMMSLRRTFLLSFFFFFDVLTYSSLTCIVLEIMKMRFKSGGIAL